MIKVFPNSKVADVVYHYSNKKDVEFKSDFLEGYAAEHGVSPNAIFFLGKKAPEESFLSKRPYVGEYLLNLENPLIVDGKEYGINEGVDKALEEKKDGVIFKNIWDNQMHCDVYVVFSPGQVHKMK